MKTLRAKIALLLVTSIVAVVALITITMIYAFSAPEEDVVNRLAKQLILMERLAARDPGDARELAAQPALGRLDEERTRNVPRGHRQTWNAIGHGRNIRGQPVSDGFSARWIARVAGDRH